MRALWGSACGAAERMVGEAAVALLYAQLSCKGGLGAVQLSEQGDKLLGGRQAV
jgi:hypothetical protein